MPMRYEWVDDYAAFPVPDHFAELDPYSQWLLGHGQAFDFQADETPEDPRDFTYVGAIYAKPDGDGVADPTDPGALHTRIADGGPIQPGRIPDVVKAGDITLDRLPLRARSVGLAQGGGGQGGGDACDAPPYAPPDALDATEVVVVAAIDDGVNPVHERFRIGAAGTRMDYFWVQDGVYRTSDPDLAFGREYERSELEAAIAAHGDDEERMLTELGLIDFSHYGFNRLAHRVTHGTHVLDTAAGAAPSDAKAAQRLIGVLLPAMATLETSGALIPYFAMQAFEYILARTRRISAALGEGIKCPCVVNFSYGYSGGPHNGRYVLERAFEQALKRHQMQGGGAAYLVLPTGNRQLKRGHAAATQKDDKAYPLRLKWRAPPSDRSPNYLEVWAPTDGRHGRRHSFKVVITPPDGEEVELKLRQGDAMVLTRRGGRGDDEEDHGRHRHGGHGHGHGGHGHGRPLARAVIARITVDVGLKDPQGAPLQRLTLVTAPTNTDGRDRDPAPSGLWRVRVDAGLEEGERLHAWVQRDEPPMNFRRRGYQSFLDSPGYDRFAPDGDIQDVDSPRTRGPVTRFGTISGLTTGSSPVVVGGYWGRPYQAATSFYSATALRDPAYRPGDGPRRPNGAARTDTSRALPGILGAGARSGSWVALNGTSVAAPQVTREIAKRLAAGAPVDPNGMFTEPVTDPLREGHGRLPVDPDLRYQVERNFP